MEEREGRRTGGGSFRLLLLCKHAHTNQLMGFDGISWKPQSDPAPTPPLFERQG